MQNEPLVYVLILNWNSFEETVECVTACERLDYSNFQVLVLDNGSRDASLERLTKRFPEIELTQTGANLGYASGNNMGIRHALDKGAECVWILNPDVVVDSASLSTLMRVLTETPSIGICGPRVIHGKGPNAFAFDGLSIDSDGGYHWRFNISGRNATATRPILSDVDCVSGCSMLIRSELLRSVGLFREDFFLYYEDVELSFRARDHGWRTVVCMGTAVDHDRNAETKRPATGFRAERSRIVFARLRHNCTLKVLLTKPNAELLFDTLKQRRPFDVCVLLLKISLGILSGLVKPRKSLPTYASA